MRNWSFSEEAEKCRQQALSYLSRPEAPFLLRIAREFDRLERERREQQGRSIDH